MASKTSRGDTAPNRSAWHRESDRRSGAEVLAALEALTGSEHWYTAETARKRIARIADLRATIADLHAQEVPLEAEWQRERWSRFFLVVSSDGHIHSSMNCSTCHPHTRYAWLPDLSGLTEADAVEAHGTRLCSICYPSAPVEWTILPVKEDPKKCPGSGRPATIDRRGSWCPECGTWVRATNLGTTPRHHRKDS